MHSKSNLLDEEKIKRRIDFNPDPGMSSTIMSDMQRRLKRVNERVATLTLDQSSISNNLDVLNETTIEGEASDLTSVRTELEETMKDTTEIASELSDLKVEYKELERKTNEELLKRQDEVNNLKTKIHTQTEELETQKRTQAVLEEQCNDKSNIINEQLESIEELKQKIHSLRSIKIKQKAQEQELESYDHQMKDLTEYVGTLNKNKIDLNKKLNQLKTEYKECQESKTDNEYNLRDA